MSDYDFDYTGVLEDDDVDEYGTPTFELMDEEMANWHIAHQTDYVDEAYKSLEFLQGNY